jgi:DNA-binding LytR/AlgR family response regulator
MTLLLVDDNKKELQNLVSLVQEWQAKKQIEAGLETPLRFCSYSSVKEVLQAFEQGNQRFHPNCAILDIYMPEMKGTDLAVILRKQSFTGPIVFLTSSNEFAAESYEVKAHAYLLKPVDKKKLFHLLDEFRVLLHKNNAKPVDDAHIVLNTKKFKTILYYRDIKWVEVRAHALFYHIEKNGIEEELKITGTLKELSEILLKDSRFAVSHNSFIVNMDCIATIKQNEIVLHDGSKLPISRRHSAFKAKYVDYALEKAKQCL